MGNYKDNYIINLEYNNEVQIYVGTVLHKKLSNTYKVFNDDNRENLEKELFAYMRDIDKKYIDTYNQLRENTRNNLYKESVSKGVDWIKLKEEKQIHWQRESKIFLYDKYGKPIFYLDVKGSKSTTAPSKVFLAINNFFKSKETNELNKNYETNFERNLLFKEEIKKWENEYHEYIDNIVSDYNRKKKYAVELYYKIILQNIKFTIDERIEIDKKIFNFNLDNNSLNFNVENKILTINYGLPNKNDIKNLIYDKKIESEGVYKTINRGSDEKLYQVYYQIIFTFIDWVFRNDTELDAISAISFIGNNSIKHQSNIELIIGKKEYYKSIPYQFELFDFISKFNRNQVLFQYLEREGINIFDSSMDGHEIVIKETKIDEKILNILSQFNELESLYLIDNDLKDIPKVLYSFSNLKELYIHSNNIKSIFTEIVNLNFLEILSLEDNDISKLPNYLFKLNKLRILNLKNNRIEDISIENLEKLLSFEKCNLKNNELLYKISDKNITDKEIIIELIRLKKDRHIASKKKIQPIKEKFNKINNRPLIITEGKTDWKHLKKALERFQSEEFNLYVDLDIEFKEYEEVSMSDSELDDYAQSHAKSKNSRKHICIFDRDLSSRVEAYGKHDFIQVGNKQYLNTLKGKCQKKYGKRSPKYLELEQKLDDSQFKEIDLEIRKVLTGDEQEEWETLLHNNVYAFCIPKLNDELDEICIEFYYKDKDLKKEDDEGKRLFVADEFEFQENVNNCNRFISKCGQYKTDTQSGNSNNKKITLQYPNKKERGYVYKVDEEECNKSNTMNLSKNKFAENIYYDVEGFDDFDIENFRLIFDVIEKIVDG